MPAKRTKKPKTQPKSEKVLPTVALAMICKGTEEEAQMLRRCLRTVSPHVDAIYVAVSQSGGEHSGNFYDIVSSAADGKPWDVKLFEWEHDFAKARNLSFSMVPKTYDYVIWCDADDAWRGLEDLKETMHQHPADAYAFYYLYAFDDEKEPSVAHVKTMVVKNDGTFSWSGKIHEDLGTPRQASLYLVERGIDRLHLTTPERLESASGRNIAIAEQYRASAPEDPRSRFTLAQALWGSGQTDRATEELRQFLAETDSDQDRYQAMLWLAGFHADRDERKDAEQLLREAIGLMPTVPDAYLTLGRLYKAWKRYEEAERYLLLGIERRPYAIGALVSNPRDYDRNPLLVLGEIYMAIGRPHYALKAFQAVLKISPNMKHVGDLVAEMEVETQALEWVVNFMKGMEGKTDDEQRELIKTVPAKYRNHPAVCAKWNRLFVREESDGKQIAYFCGYTHHEWSAATFKTKGVGGSEEAVVHLARQWAAKGYQVTVFNNCGPTDVADPDAPGVTYRPFWTYNPRDKWDVLVLWRQAMLLDHPLNASKILVDVHDVMPKEEFTEKRLAAVTKVMVKTQAHRVLFPNIPDDKIAVVPNGLDVGGIPDLPKEEKLVINTSSPDRSMDVLPALWKRVKEQVPDARLVWMYGWDVFDQAHERSERMQRWKAETVAKIEDAGIECLGKVPQGVALEWYARAKALAYPTEFYEIDCISVKKAQAAGCVPVTTDFAALAESVQHGIKVHSPKTKDDWCKPYQASFGISEKHVQDEWVNEMVNLLNGCTAVDDAAMRQFGRSFKWDRIASLWQTNWSS